MIFSELEYIPLEYPSYDFSLLTRDEAAWQEIAKFDNSALFFHHGLGGGGLCPHEDDFILFLNNHWLCFPFGLTLLFLIFLLFFISPG